MLRLLPTILLTTSALAHTPMQDEDGRSLVLAEGPDGSPYLGLVVLPGNRAGIGATELIEATNEALGRWHSASGGRLSHDVWKPEDQNAYRAQIKQDGISTVFFVENMKDPVKELGEDFRGIAYTHVWTDEDGRIVEIDLAINDRDFGFFTDPEAVDYQITGRFHLLQDVLTHELGHALGLDHTGVMSSTQFTYAWNGQHELGCDDQAGMRALYGDGSSGSLSGRVVSDDGGALAGAHIVAISLDRRTPYASAVSTADGAFSIDGLEAGRYQILVEPWLAGEQTLTGPEVNPSCGPGTLSRTPIVDADGAMQTWTVEASSQDVGELVARCTGDGSAAVETGMDDRVLLSGNGAGSVADVLAPGETRRLKLEGISGQLVVVPMAWSVFSPMRARMALFDADGNEVDALERAPLFSDETTGYRNLDGLLVASDLPLGDYTLELRSQALPEDVFPRSDLYLDDAPYVVITASAGEAVDTTALLEGDLTRCRDLGSEADFTPVGEPIPDPHGCSSSAAPVGLLLTGLSVLLAGLGRRRGRRY